MPFDDNDLKRLYESVHHPEKPYHKPRRELIVALLARLEASEWALNGFIRLEQEKENYDEVCSRVKAWRKAMGV